MVPIKNITKNNMDKNSIIGTGLTGLVGSRIVELLSDFHFENISRSTGVDITNKEAVLTAIKNSPASVVLHMAAKTNVDGCEADKQFGENGEAWKINVLGTANIVEACEKTGKKLVYISTDMVFPGDKPISETYSEEEMPNPKNWYATTKYQAERLVSSAQTSTLILRIAYPYRANFEKKEYVRVFIDLLKNQKAIKTVEDHYFTPTFIDDIPTALNLLLKTNQTGIFHVVGKETVSPFIVAQKIAQTFDFDSSLISKTTREEYFKNKAYRGFNLSLNNDKIEKLGISLTSFSQGLEEIKKQIL